jgi:hypothetical protein
MRWSCVLKVYSWFQARVSIQEVCHAVRVNVREDRTLTFTFVVFVVVALCCATNVEISRLMETE